HLGAHVAADALADPAEVERPTLLRHLLRLAVDVVDDVVGTHEHAGAALAAAAECDDLVHHLLEGDVRHGGRTVRSADPASQLRAVRRETPCRHRTPSNPTSPYPTTSC